MSQHKVVHMSRVVNQRDCNVDASMLKHGCLCPEMILHNPSRRREGRMKQVLMNCCRLSSPQAETVHSSEAADEGLTKKRREGGELISVDVLCLAVGLLQLVLVLFDVGRGHLLQALQTLRQLGTHRLHNGHQSTLGLLQVDGHLLTQLLHNRLHPGSQGVHLSCVLGVVLRDDGLQLGTVFLNVLVDDIPQLGTLGLELTLQ
ncbi:hypothetical protein INR49_015840, partial [Caranx melampygus]